MVVRLRACATLSQSRWNASRAVFPPNELFATTVVDIATDKSILRFEYEARAPRPPPAVHAIVTVFHVDSEQKHA
eukprot:COSAG05_NODE_1891_length_3884_cov_5.929450_2_plen_75_part_00